MTDPAKYDPEFKLNREALAKTAVIPSVPPPRRQAR